MKEFLPCPKPKYRKHNKKITVTDKTYQTVYERDDGLCRLCGKSDIELHHIIYRSEDKTKINDINNCIMLCVKCHKLVHKNKHKWQPKLKEMIERKIYMWKVG